MKLSELKEKCNQLGIIPQPTRQKKNSDVPEVCVDDCIRAIQQYNLSLLKDSMPQKCENLSKLIQIKSPMLAKLIKHQPENIQKEIWDDNILNWRFEKKYDGIRCFIYYNSSTFTYSIYGRSLDEETMLPKDYSDRFEFTSITMQFAPILDLLTKDFILDCEFIIDGYTHEILEEILNDPYKDMEQFKYKFIVFDILSIPDEYVLKMTLRERLELLNDFFGCWHRRILPLYRVESKPDTMTKEEYYNFLISNGGEGIIAKNLDSYYDIRGKRNGDWTKIKRLRYEGTSNLNEDTYDLFVSNYIINDNIISGLELSSYLVDENNNYIYDKFNNYVPITLGILYDLLPDTKKSLTLYDSNNKPYINPRFLDMVIEVRSTGFDDSTEQLQNLKFVCWRLDKNSRDCKFNKNKI